MKQIKFIGKTYSVPDWAKFITQSKSGLIEVWKHQPNYSGDYWYYGYEYQYRVDNHEVICEEREMTIEEIE